MTQRSASNHQQAALLELMDFNKINQGLYATTFLAYGGKGKFCHSCMLSDHTVEECALHPSKSVLVIHIGEWISERSKEEAQMPRGQERRRPPRGACLAWNDGRCSTPYIAASAIVAHGVGVRTTESPSVALIWSQTGEGRIEDWIAPRKDKWQGL